MNTYRKIHFKIANKHFLHFFNPSATHYHDGNEYGRSSMVRSIPEGYNGRPEDFAVSVIDNLYDRMNEYKKNEERLYYTAKNTRNLKNMCK